jgi:hypothetical protein
MRLNVTRNPRSDCHMLWGVQRHRFALLSLLALFPVFLHGCGTAQVRSQIILGTPVWEHVTDSAYVAACVDGDSIWTVSAFSIDRWSLEGDRPPKFVEKTTRIPNDEPPFSMKSCPSTSQAHSLSAQRPFQRSLKGEDTFVVSPSGRAVLRGGHRLDERRLPAGLTDTTFDGRSIWAVGAHSLWRWRPGQTSLTPVMLPVDVSTRGPVGVFRDGTALWVRTRDNTGWPLVIQGNFARHVGRAGSLAKPSVGIELSLGQSGIQWAGPGEDLVAESKSGDPLRISQVDAFMPLRSRYALVAAAETVALWDFQRAAPVRIARWRFGSPTLRFFVHGDVIYAVGVSYGVVSGRIPGLTVNRRDTNSYK